MAYANDMERDEPKRRVFEATKAEPGEVPLLIGLVGPPGGGKTWSALRLARGMQRARARSC
jgi:pantothenate kinase-related protein Tda10